MIILEIFQYGFMIRAMQSGIMVAAVAPLIGVFLVLKRYSLIADTLAHVSFAGIALGVMFSIHPMIAAIGSAMIASLGIEKLRSSKKMYGESALAILLSGSLALAIVLLSVSKGFTNDLFNYLFGNILTVTTYEVYLIMALSVIVLLAVVLLYKELLYTTFDEDSARIAGIPTKFINGVLIILSALTVALAIPIVGVLLISALIVIPSVTALQLKKSFFATIVYAEVFSIGSVVLGIIVSFYANLSTSGTIVLIMISILLAVLFLKKK